MSAGYAKRLSPYENKGVCGLPESIDSNRVLQSKIKKLASLIQQSRHLVVLTGAGVSTAAGIPDFRGPKGVWTVEEKEKRRLKKRRQTQTQTKKKCGASANTVLSKKKARFDKNENEENDDHAVGNDISGEEKKDAEVGEPSSSSSEEKQSAASSSGPLTNGKKKKSHNNNDDSDTSNEPPPSFSDAQPTLTHRAISKLASLNILKHCITQNVDGLHHRSGLPRSKHSVLHGCVFTEKCETCHTEYFRDFDVGGLSFQRTGRVCTDTPGCKGDLRDTILDWDDELPDHDWEVSQFECAKADLLIALGTSLRIEPAGSLPLRAKRFVIVNLQQTPYDHMAHMVIKGKVDDVMSRLMDCLDLQGWDDDDNGDGDEILEKPQQQQKISAADNSKDACSKKEGY